MRNVWRLFAGDLRRLRGNVVTIITVIGLVALPSIFSWYNIIACWDVFENTGNLTVAVANSDEGYESDLMPLRVEIGDKVESALRANDQLNWVFTDEADAIEGVRSGRYYAAVVIPASFSRDMMSFFSADVEHASIMYYSNQKKSAIAPKVTDQGADRVSAQVNEVFAETVSEIALGMASSMLGYLDDADANGKIGDVADHVDDLGAQMDASASALEAYSTVLSSSKALVDESDTLLAQARESAEKLEEPAREAQSTAADVVSTLDQAKATLDDATSQLEADYAAVPDSVGKAFDGAAQSASDAEQLLRDEADVVAGLGNEKGANELRAAADAVHDSNAETQGARQSVNDLAAQAQADLQEAKGAYDGDVRPALDELRSIMGDVEQSAAGGVSALRSSGDDLAGVTSSLSEKLAVTQGKLDDAIAELEASADELDAMADRIRQALLTGDAGALRKIVGSDPADLAAAIAAPVRLERTAVYAADNFGSAMAPLYTTLALWIGALLLMVTLKVVPSEKSLRELRNPTPRQVFMGRFLTIAMLSLLQSTVLSLGNLLFLGIQALHPLLYVLCFWVSGLVFAFIIYTMVALFANLGKALGVVLLIVQVAGGGGSFPLQLLPQFFQDMSPYLPIAHAVQAMRAAMFGIYNGDFWVQIGQLVLFVVPFALLGLVLQKPLSKVVPRFVERVERSELM